MVVPHQGTVLSNLRGIASGVFSSSWSCCSCYSSLFRSTAQWLLLERECLLFLGDTPVSCLFRVTNWFLFGERLFPFGKMPTASCLLKTTTNQLLLGKRFFSWVWIKRQVGLPVHSPKKPPGAFAFDSFWVFHLCPHTPPVYYCC